MEPFIIALICAASFGAVITVAAFIRHLLLSRDKNINDEAQKQALQQEVSNFEAIREHMQNNKRFDSHYKMLGENKEAIVQLDTKIDALVHEKITLIERYTRRSMTESRAIVRDGPSKLRKYACDRLRLEIDKKLQLYDQEIDVLQQRRKSLWTTHNELQEHLLKQEQARNANLDAIYKQHSALLEKLYIRHIDNSERIASQTMTEGTSFFQSAIMAPIQFLMGYFNVSPGITLVHTRVESARRAEVAKTQEALNNVHAADPCDLHHDTSSSVPEVP